MDRLSDLNPQQREAVTAAPGPILVLAGPGSGKTRVLTYRLAYLIQELKVPAAEILALTFTNKAAREMEGRALSLLGGSRATGVPRLGTFHSTFARILRIEADRLPVTRDFVIFDDVDQLELVRQSLKELNQDPKQVQPRRVLASISRAKNEMIEPQAFASDTYFTEITRRVYERYQQLLLANNALDFDDLLLLPIQLFSEHEATLHTYRRRYPHLLVDEFQDTNTAQYTLLRMLAGAKPDLFAVADPDQSIYRWRGADYRNVKRLRDDFPDLNTLLLEQNYRSTQTILDAAMAVIDRQPDRQHKQLFTERGTGDPILIHEAYDQDEEGQFVVEKISMLTLTGEAEPGDFAVMYRTNAQSRAIEEAFLRAGLPYRLVGAQRFYGRKEVKDLIAYLRLIHNPVDQVSLERAIRTPPRGIGDKTLAALWAAADQAEATPIDILLMLGRGVEVTGISARARTPLAQFGALLSGWLEIKDRVLLDSLIDRVLEDVEYRGYLGSDEDRWANVMELRGVAQEFSELGLVEFLQQVALVSDQDTLTENLNAPTLLTLHAAKGLEFPIVFIVGLDEGELPHYRSQDDPEAMAEERRLFYVGLTRAQDRVILLRAFRRRSRGVSSLTDPSRFLDDLPADLIEGDLIGMRTPAQAGYDRETSWQGRVPAPTEARFQAGMRVIHPQFGEGIVLETQLEYDDEEVTVNFEEVGVKHLVASMASLEIEDP
ncbi:MAG: UvrD-helicase domain-containing protein [Chloroflexi bacterium]|nr:UvrD-helicase domain-containing protein [Chloroflexota bacterium]